MNITIIMKTNQLKRITIETPNLFTHANKENHNHYKYYELI